MKWVIAFGSIMVIAVTMLASCGNIGKTSYL